jgi:hypothetical protein
MMIRTLQSLIVASVFVGSARAADDPFVGKWKLNQDKSKIVGQQLKIEDLGSKKYKISFGDNSDTITADGTDQPIRYGRTESIATEGSNTWKMVIKLDSKVISSMTHTLSEDGSTQTIKGTDTKPDGSTSDYTFELKRVGGGSGWAGTWESTNANLGSPDELDIEPYSRRGLTFAYPTYQDTQSMNFDGKDYEEKGPRAAPGSTASGKRINDHTLEITDKVKGKVTDHAKYQISGNGKTLTVTYQGTGQAKALTFVYDKI